MGLDWVEARGIDTIDEVPDLWYLIITTIILRNKTFKDFMLIFMQGSIFLEGLVSLLPIVYALRKLLLRASWHMVYVDWTKVVIIDELETHPSVTMFLSWIQVRLYICPPEDCDQFILNQNSVCNRRVSEWSNSFRVTSNHRGPTDDWSTSNYLLIMCEILAIVGAVCGIPFGTIRFKTVPQSITEGFPIYY